MKRLPPDLRKALSELQDHAAKAEQHGRNGRPHYWGMGKAWFEVKAHPALDKHNPDNELRVTMEDLRPFLPHSPQFLNRCLVAWDGEQTGDLAEGERWVAAMRHHLQYVDEPFRMAEIVEAYRNRHKKRRQTRLPLAMIERRLYVRNEKARFPHGSAVFGDALPLLRATPAELIDFIYNDPPFGLWGDISHGHHGKIIHEWDKPLDWPILWPELWRVLSPCGTIAISAAEPLASVLAANQLEKFLYRWWWLRRATNIYGPKYGRPLNVIEPIAVFSEVGHTQRTYHAQMRPLDEAVVYTRKLGQRLLSKLAEELPLVNQKSYHALQPIDLIEAPRTKWDSPRIMHGQKPVELIRFLLRTHTNPDDLVLDPTAGSMTTAVACVLEGRRFLVFEKHRPHFVLGVRRLTHVYAQVRGPRAA